MRDVCCWSVWRHGCRASLILYKRRERELNSRLEFDLILMYKISHNLCDLNFSDYFVFQTCDYNLRRHDFTVQSLFHNASRDQFHQFYFNYIVSTWNRLPDVVVSAFNLSIFKTKLKSHDLHTIGSLIY